MADNQKNVIKPILRKLALAPELRDEPPKGAYPGGRIKQTFAVFRAEMNSIMRVNIWFILYTLPLIALLIYVMPLMVNNMLQKFNFMGNIGVGYPGTSDSITDAALALYGVYKNVLWLLVPCLVVMSIGLSGLFNCCKKYMWGEKVSPTKDFYSGVKKFWWKYLAAMSVFSLILVAGGQTVLWHMSNIAVGNGDALSWIVTVIVCLVCLALLTVFGILLPMICTYDLSLLKLVKNALILDSQLILLSLMMLLFAALPVVLLLTVDILGFLIYMLMFMFGFAFYGLAFSGFGQLAFDNITTPLYNASVAPQKKNAGKRNKGKNPTTEN